MAQAVIAVGLSSRLPEECIFEGARSAQLSLLRQSASGTDLSGLYSIVVACIANGVEPTAYLTDVLPRIRDATTDAEHDALLPDRWTAVGDAG